jgi:hypothetical protein
MEPRSPTIEGFRLIFRRPLVGFAELAWRWTFGAAAVAVCGFAFFQYLNTLFVSNADLFFLRTRHPFFVSQALAHILRGSAPRFVITGIVLGIALALAWIVAASFGRAATVRAIAAHFATDETEAIAPPVSLRALMGLNFLRAAAALAAVVGWFGAFLVAGLAFPGTSPGPVLAFLLFWALVALLWLAWSITNWFLSLAAVFVVTRNLDTLDALTGAVDLCRDRLGTVIAISSWFGLAHLGAFIVGSAVSFSILVFAGVVPPGFVLLGMALITLIYFFVADYLYTGRLAAYLFAIEGLDRSVGISPPPLMTPPAGGFIPDQPSAAGFDRDELILSDVPLPTA